MCALLTATANAAYYVDHVRAAYCLGFEITTPVPEPEALNERPFLHQAKSKHVQYQSTWQHINLSTKFAFLLRVNSVSAERLWRVSTARVTQQYCRQVRTTEDQPSTDMQSVRSLAFCSKCYFKE